MLSALLRSMASALLLVSLLFVAPLHAQTKDTIPPVLKLKGDSIMLLGVQQTFVDPGITITDNHDTITGWDTAGTFYKTFPDGVARKLGTYVIFYRVSDKSHNTDSIARVISVVDTIAPRIVYKGDSIYCVEVGEGIWDSGYVVVDNYMYGGSGVLVSLESCTMEIFSKTPQPGEYKYRYRAKDGSGNVGYSRWRYMIVKNAGDTSPCVLKYALKDTCVKLAAIRMEEETALGDVRLFPNPAAGHVTVQVQANLHKEAIVRLLDMSGQCLQQRYFVFDGFDNRVELNTSALTDGIYLVELSNSYGRVLRRLTVVH